MGLRIHCISTDNCFLVFPPTFAEAKGPEFLSLKIWSCEEILEVYIRS